MTTKKRLATALTVIALGTTACGGTGGAGPGGGGQAELPAGEWLLVDGERSGEQIPIVDGREITLVVDGEQWGGTAACNSYGATVTIDGDHLSIQELIQTEMACPVEGVMESEAAYLEAFGAVDRYTQDDDELTLEGDEVRLRYEEVPPEPDADLEETEWQLESLVEGAGPDGSVSSVQGEPVVIFEPDGLLIAHDACRSINATWERTDDGVRVEEPGYDDVGCPPELEVQDEFLRSVLDGELEATIEGGTLRLTHPDGRGLDLRAR